MRLKGLTGGHLQTKQRGRREPDKWSKRLGGNFSWCEVGWVCFVTLGSPTFGTFQERKTACQQNICLLNTKIKAALFTATTSLSDRRVAAITTGKRSLQHHCSHHSAVNGVRDVCEKQSSEDLSRRLASLDAQVSHSKSKCLMKAPL